MALSMKAIFIPMTHFLKILVTVDSNMQQSKVN